MEEFALSFWIYMGVMSVFVGGVLRKSLAAHIRAAATIVAWLGVTVLVARLYWLSLLGFLLAAVLAAACCLYAGRRAPVPGLPVDSKVVFITGRTPCTSPSALVVTLKLFYAVFSHRVPKSKKKRVKSYVLLSYMFSPVCSVVTQ